MPQTPCTPKTSQGSSTRSKRLSMVTPHKPARPATTPIINAPPPALKQDKLAFMAATADAQLLNYVAWPQATLHGGRGGKVIGFMMPKVSGKEPIHMIYSPAHRRQSYPHCAWDFLLYVARNIASSFATVHE
eukprot:158210_1